MLIIEKFILPNEKLFKTIEGELNFDVVKYSIYWNPVHLMLLWWESNIFYNTRSISKDENIS